MVLHAAHEGRTGSAGVRYEQILRGAEEACAVGRQGGVALLTTCGYPPEKGADLWESGVKRYCKHSQLRYAGMLAEHDPGYRSVFMDAEKEAHARQFAQMLLAAVPETGEGKE